MCRNIESPLDIQHSSKNEWKRENEKRREKSDGKKERICVKISNNFVYVHGAFSIGNIPVSMREKILRERCIKFHFTFISVSDFQKPSNAQHCSQAGY